MGENGTDNGKPRAAPRHHGSRPAKPSPMRNPPLVPLIDIFLFLIIYFLLSCQFHQYEGTIPANLPNTSAGTNTGGITVTPTRVTLTAAGSNNHGVEIEVGSPPRRMEDMDALFRHLSDARNHYGANADKLTVIIKPLRGVRWGHVVDAFNQAVRAGLKEVGVAPSGPPR